jgi:hypothetical protein
MPANDPGSKDDYAADLLQAPIPHIPRALSGSHTLDNVTFSTVQKRLAVKPARARKRNNVYIRLPGLLARPIRPRKFMYVLNTTITTLRTLGAAQKATDTDGATTDVTRTFTSAAATFETNLVVPGDVLIITTGSQKAQYTIVKVVSETEVTVDRNFTATTAANTYHVIRPNTFPAVANELIEFGNLEMRDDTSALVTQVTPL